MLREDAEVDGVRSLEDAAVRDAEAAEIRTRGAARHEEAGGEVERDPSQPNGRGASGACVSARTLDPQERPCTRHARRQEKLPERRLVPAADDDRLGTLCAQEPEHAATHHHPARAAAQAPPAEHDFAEAKLLP